MSPFMSQQMPRQYVSNGAVMVSTSSQWQSPNMSDGSGNYIVSGPILYNDETGATTQIQDARPVMSDAAQGCYPRHPAVWDSSTNAQKVPIANKGDNNYYQPQHQH
eukprot:TRINITY_DN87142_c0_g1_i1.p1 TRINITY_DN87142_c0_g1~~TRINITY_DN87142_c0_g1_i1.p1  ORF type:complete len:106 (-),score=4.64 TRINITY_DN87142_c0_g1_i1:160-477(-)